MNKAIGDMEEIIGPLSNPYRSAWNRIFNFKFQHNESDETLPVTVRLSPAFSGTSSYQRVRSPSPSTTSSPRFRN
jgi:hypothetical protein